MTGSETPPASTEHVARRMRSTKQRDTPAELAVRKEVHRRGLRYFVDKRIPGVTRGRPDLVFPRTKVAVFIDGCFWHSCPTHSTIPNINRTWWEEKLAANVSRDRRHDRELQAHGWTVLRFWEHEDPIDTADQIQAVVSKQRPG